MLNLLTNKFHTDMINLPLKHFKIQNFIYNEYCIDIHNTI